MTPAPVPALINNKILKWARKKVNLSIQEAAELIKVPEQTLVEWETGKKLPSTSQLETIAEIYLQPFSAFYLPNIPKSPKNKKIQCLKNLPYQMQKIITFAHNLKYQTQNPPPPTIENIQKLLLNKWPKDTPPPAIVVTSPLNVNIFIPYKTLPIIISQNPKTFPLKLLLSTKTTIQYTQPTNENT